MENLQVRTINGNNAPIYKTNVKNVIVFLRHDEDKIIAKSKEQVEIEVIHNGETIFIGTKEEFYNKLKS